MATGIIQGLGPDGQSKSIGATADGELRVDASSDASAGGADETNRLLRKLIAGLELYLGVEFPNVE